LRSERWKWVRQGGDAKANVSVPARLRIWKRLLELNDGTREQAQDKTLVMVLAMVVCANTAPAVETWHVDDRRREFTARPRACVWAHRCQSNYLAGHLLSARLHDLLYDVLSWADYSYVMPAGAFGYAVLTFLAVIFLHESVSPRRWVGVLLICIGVMLVGQTKPRTTGVAAHRKQSRDGHVSPSGALLCTTTGGEIAMTMA